SFSPMYHPFSLDPKKLIAGKYFGQFQSIFSGLGTEVTDVRPYTPGDSAKTINWKTTAKHQQLYSNVYQQEKAIAIDIFLDVNYNRNGKMQGKRNVDVVREMFSDIILYAKTYGATLTLLYPETSGRLWKSTKLRELVVGKNYEKAIDLMIKLSAIVKKQSTKYHTYLSEVLGHISTNKGRFTRHGGRAIVVFSDFLALNEQQVKQLQQAKKEHLLVLFQLPVNKEMGQNYDRGMMREEKTVGIELMKIQ
ncbi:MAG: DUF58 domain-containing protein, partial [candidate division SR1 bacterium]|nr:DUF58 domain-containing protein [candidate division SR1 bacterium]